MAACGIEDTFICLHILSDSEMPIRVSQATGNKENVSFTLNRFT